MSYCFYFSYAEFYTSLSSYNLLSACQIPCVSIARKSQKSHNALES